MIIILLGPPGSGKGTQSGMLFSSLGLQHLSIGQLLRKEYEKKTKIGLEAEKYWGQKGINVPTRISFSLLSKYLKKGVDIVLDNFPRTKENLKKLSDYLESHNLAVDLVFHLRVGKDQSHQRLLVRAKDDQKNFGKMRKDETEKLIKIRQKIGYEKGIRKILEYYRNKKILFEIDGEQSPKKVHQNILKIIKNYGQTER